VVVDSLQQMTTMCNRRMLQLVTAVHHTSSNVYRLVTAFLKVGFVTQTAIAQTAAMNVVRASVYC